MKSLRMTSEQHEAWKAKQARAYADQRANTPRGASACSPCVASHGESACVVKADSEARCGAPDHVAAPHERGRASSINASSAKAPADGESPSSAGHDQRAKADAPPVGPTGSPAGAASSAPIYPLVALCRAAGLPEPTPEFRFNPQRKWRADYCWPFATPRVIVEIDGGVFTQGRHTRGKGFIADQQKTNSAQLLGFAVLRYTPDRLAECIRDLQVMFAGGAA